MEIHKKSLESKVKIIPGVKPQVARVWFETAVLSTTPQRSYVTIGNLSCATDLASGSLELFTLPFPALTYLVDQNSNAYPSKKN
jgi:hypothetical protein